MKKTLLASAMSLGFLHIAHANDVTVYGVVDLGYQYTRHSADNTGRTTKNALESGHQAGSRLGFKGTEDIGNGNKVNFVLESGFQADTGEHASKGVLFNRQAWLGLSNNAWGDVRFGRQKTVSAEFFEQADPFAEGFNPSALAKVFISSGQRSNNMIKYLTPALLDKRLILSVNYSTNVTSQEVAGNGNNTRLAAAAAKYDDGALVAIASYDRVSYANTPTKNNGSENFWQIGVNYDFAKSSLNLPFKLYGAYGRNGSYLFANGKKTTDIPAAVEGSVNVWMLGASMPVAGGSLFTSYYRASDWDVRSAQIGYTYPLSKRTNLYTYFASTTGIAQDTKLVTTSNDFTDKNNNRLSRFSVGVRHRF